MGYDGKPSKGCGNCRSRKIRCDKARPACWQCTRTDRECSGYRDELSLMFRDQTESVARKARASQSLGRGSRSPDSLQGRTSPSQNELARNPNTGLSKNEAIAFFLHSHAIPGNFLITETLSRFLMVPNGSLGQQAIQYSIAAVASAMLARARNVMSLKQVARHEYGIALKLVNEALTDVEEAKTDQTLGAVVFLALYEIVTSRSPQGIESWTSHIGGAAALLRHRGAAQLQSVVGIRLFLHLRYQIIISCLQRDVFVPGPLLERTKLDMIPEIKNALGNKLILIIGYLANLRANIHTKVLTEPEEILSVARTIEADLLAWLAAIPPDFTYSTHKIPPTDRSFERNFYGIRPYNDEYHIYPDIWAPNCWNHYRCARILVSEIILTQVQRLSNNLSACSSEDPKFYCKSLRSTIRELGVDICRSVPFHLGTCNSEVLPGMPMLPPESYLGGLMLLWPLFVAGIVEGPNHPQRRWVVECLRIIGNTWGMAQALAEMDLLIVDPGMFHSVERYGDAADMEVASSDVLPFSIFHVPYYDLAALKEYRELRATSP